MAIITMILGFFGNIVKGVITDALKTPAITTTVDDTASAIDTVATPIDDVVDQYQWMLDRS